ncbi:protealysin inhibitor emfourin [Herbiconiux sp. UC225_62]|uniref:protealysin inhibitor emfourin n=1 Tax=Herbiconiux sp. UC225_62 TaxID=3350168 RepID=UPI0036D2BF61
MTPQDDDTPGPDAAAGTSDANDTRAPDATGTGGADREPNASDDTPSGVGSELRITVARSGGIAGIGPQWTVTASEEADVDSWLSLVESCPWDPPEASTGSAGSAPIGGAPDRFVYTIRVFLPTAEERDARVPEQRLDGPWRTLVDRVKDAAR